MFIENARYQLTLNKLIGSGTYDNVLANIKQEQKDKGYTDEWLESRIRDLNKEWRDTVQQAVVQTKRVINQKQGEYDKVKDANFNHNYTPQDYADLQYLQTLIKARILNECNGEPVLVERILGEFIHTQKGARAIMFLANDSDIGNLVKSYYMPAAENARTAAETRFDADKAAKLAQMDKEITPLLQMSVIGDAMLKQAEDRVSDDNVKIATDYYFGAGKEKDCPQPQWVLTKGDDRRV